MTRKVDIYVNGCFHALYLAAELDKRQYLNSVFAAYPKFRCVKQYAIDPKKITSSLSNFAINYAARKFSQFSGLNLDPTYFLAKRFDKKSKKKLNKKTDIVVCWSSSALQTLIAAKKKNIISVLESGSAHVNVNRRLLAEEYQNKRSLSDPRVVDLQLQEYAAADYISVPSEFVKKSFVAEGIAEHKIIVTPYGIDIDLFKPEKRVKSKFRILFVGLVSQQKGVHYLIQAFKQLKLIEAELWLVGAIAPDMQDYVKQNSAENIKLFGSIEYAKLPSFYTQASVFCLPSIQDGFGLVALQAMACGLPLICTQNCGAADLITDHEQGFVIPIRSVDHLKEKLLYFYDHPEAAAQMGINARNLVQENYTWQQYASKMIQHYEGFYCRGVPG